MNSGRPRLDWIKTALRLAYEIADCRVQDPYRQVGCCGVKHNKDFVIGYNGPPPGIEIDWSNKKLRHPYIIHAEINVLNKVSPGDLEFIVVTHKPCPNCILAIKNKLLDIVYYCEEGTKNYQKYSNLSSEEMAATLKLQMVQINLE